MKKEYFEKAKNSWAANIGKFQLKWPDESIIRFLAKTFPGDKRDDVKILELGCGSGRNVVAMGAEGFDAYGVDYNAFSVETTLKRAEAFGVKINACEADVTSLPFSDVFFDAVIGWGLLFLLAENTQKALSEIHRVLRPNAFMFANWRADDDFFAGKGRLLAPNTYMLDERCASYGLADTVYSFYSLDELRHIYENAAFDITNVERREFWINNLEARNVWWHIWARKKS